MLSIFVRYFSVYICLFQTYRSSTNLDRSRDYGDIFYWNSSSNVLSFLRRSVRQDNRAFVLPGSLLMIFSSPLISWRYILLLHRFVFLFSSLVFVLFCFILSDDVGLEEKSGLVFTDSSGNRDKIDRRRQDDLNHVETQIKFCSTNSSIFFIRLEEI